MEYLDGIEFIYTHASGLWSAAHREHHNELYNTFSSENVIRSKSWETIRDLIIKYKGDIISINKSFSQQ